MTFAARTARMTHEHIVDVVEIEGIPLAFTTGAIDDAVLRDGRTHVHCILDLSVGERRLNLETLVEEGSSFEVNLGADPSIEWLMRSRRQVDAHFTAKIDKATPMTGSSTAPVGDTSQFERGFFFAGRETFSYSSKGASLFAGVARSLFGSKPQTHFGNGFAGESAAVFSSVPSWRGRRLRLSSCYVNADGSTTELETYATYRVQNAPAAVDGGGWAIRAESMINWYAEARCYVGQRDVSPEPGRDFYQLALSVAEEDAKLFHRGARATSVLAELTDGENEAKSMRIMTASTLSPPQVNLARADQISPSHSTLLSPPPPVSLPQWTSIRHVTHLVGQPYDILLTLGTSYLGNLTNGDYDTLPGRVRDEFGSDEWRFGANIDADDIDIAAFEAIVGPEWTATITEEIPFGDILETFAQDCACYIFTDAEGRLTCAPFRRSVSLSAAAGVLDITDDVVLVDSAEDADVDESSVIHTATVQANWDILREQFGLTASIHDAELAARYPDSAQAAEIDSLYLTVEGQARYSSVGQHVQRGGAVSLESITRSLRRSQRQDALPSMTVRLQCAWTASLVGPGAIVAVTNERIPDLTGESLAKTPFLVVGAKPERDHTVALELFALQRSWLFAAGAAIASVTGNTYTLSATTNHGGAAPAQEFGAGWAVTLFRSATAQAFNTTVTAVLSTLKLDVANAAPFTADRIFLRNTTTAASTANAAGLRPSDAMILCADDGGERTRYS